MYNISNIKIAFIGVGIIGNVFIERLITANIVDQSNIMASDINNDKLQNLMKKYKINVTGDNLKASVFGDIIFLAVPPKEVKQVLEEIKNTITAEKLIISLAAAIPTSYIENIFSIEIPIVRVIPNTPSLIGKGVNPFVYGRNVTDDHKSLIKNILAAFGDSIETQEDKMNIYTALTAVGPTYFFPIIDAIKEIAIKNGLDEKESIFAICKTIAGTAEMVLQTGKQPEELKCMIGTRTLNENEAKKIFSEAIEIAFNKMIISEKKLTN